MQKIDIIAIKWCRLGRSFTLNMADLIPNDGVTRFHSICYPQFALYTSKLVINFTVSKICLHPLSFLLVIVFFLGTGR
jgi:hypothetical protein